MIQQLFTLVWWKAAAVRGLRTALVVAVPYVPISFLGEVPYLTIASAAALAFIASLLTSVVDIPEAQGQDQTWYFAIISRISKTVAQAVVAGFGTAILIQGVDWSSIGQLALTAGFGSLLLAVLKTLPEEAPSSPSVGTIVVNQAPSVTTEVVYADVGAADIVDADLVDTPGAHEARI